MRIRGSHDFLVAKKRRDLISELTNNQGIPTSSFREIEALIIDFYKSLYKKTPSAGSIPAV